MSEAMDALTERLLARFFAAADEKKLPDGDDSEACILRAYGQLIGHFNDGTTGLGRELVKLTDALVNPDDPLVKELPMHERMALFMVVNQFRQGRAKYVQAKEDRVEGETNTEDVLIAGG